MKYISFILDETGSMSSFQNEVISGFNEYVQTLKSDITKEVKFYLTQFNSTKIDVVQKGVPLNEVITLSRKNYRPDHLTPLYDAVGKTITDMDTMMKPEDSALICIQTDGLENASREYTRPMIQSMIEDRKKLGWEFIFLGAEINAVEEAGKLSIDVGHTVSYANIGTKSMFQGLSRNTVAYINRNDANFDTTGIVTSNSSAPTSTATSGKQLSTATKEKLSMIGKSRRYFRNAKGQFTGVYESK